MTTVDPAPIASPIRRPAFLYYGAKFRLAKHYPAPKHDVIIEPFAGAAGYSLRHYTKRVFLIDAYDVICEVWKYLIHTEPAEVLRLPLLGPNDTVDDVFKPDGTKLADCERWLIGFWLNSACASPVKTFSSWGITKTFGHGEKDPSKPEWATRPDNQYWTAGTRAHVADVASRIKHWSVARGSYLESAMFGHQAGDVPVTWFIDPPYQHAGRHYKVGADSIDYGDLAAFVRSRNGQVIVCENEGADWLPFTSFVTSRSASGRANVSVEGTVTRRMTNREAIYIRG